MAVYLDPSDPGRKALGQGTTLFTLPAWHELNDVAASVRQGMRVTDAYLAHALVDVAPPEGMLACMSRAFNIVDAITHGYLRDHPLSMECADCWELWVTGPTQWYWFSDRTVLAIGVTLPNAFVQSHIKDHLDQGVPLSRAYDYTGQADIRPDYLVDCMDTEMRAGADMAQAALTCHQWATPTPTPTPTPPVDDDDEPPWVGVNIPSWVLPVGVGAVILLLVKEKL